MKKIMFKDKYGLTQAVLDGRKTMTRREVKIGRVGKIALDLFKGVDDGAVFKIMIDKRAHYKVGEVVAIAQSYENLAKWCKRFDLVHCITMRDKYATYINQQKSKGWNNKMFVSANLMQHHIRITNIRVERLQDISDEDCLREGICSNEVLWASSMETSDGYLFLEEGRAMCYKTPQQAFAGLIDKVSGKGTWERNPYVFVYEFELVD